jgi:MFS family permease
MALAIGGLNMILPIYLKNQFKLSYSQIGLFFTSSNILTLITQIPSGLFADKYGLIKIIKINTLIASIPLFIWPFIQKWQILLILYSLTYVLWTMTWPATLVFITESFTNDIRGRVISLRMTAMRFGFTLGPIISGIEYSIISSKIPFYTAGIFFLTCLIFLKKMEKK